ncbi:hypothetical protein F4802DRAFT_615738 [Xylaria palmicola]|nr:hypothetical protein F4802DRAFT_615738 [Xylaria palmicola]
MSVASKDVHTGMWTDWSKGSQVLGSTITLNSSGSRLLAAFLALYVSLSVSYLWLLVVYSIHRGRYSITIGKCRAIVRQQQALLKTGLSPTSTSIRLIKLYWAYRSTPFAWHQSWLWILISALSATSSVAAGLFSSQIIDSSLYINVLTDSSNCGFFNPKPAYDDKANDPKRTAYSQNMATLVDLATIYSRNCYNSTSEKKWEVECPFEDMCIGPATRLDTGPLNSNSLFGINSPTVDQIELRKITTCAPIRQKDYMKIGPVDPEGSPGDQIASYLYGPTDIGNATLEVNMYRANTTTTYTVENEYYFGGHSPPPGPLWFPIRELNNTQGDGTIIFLSANAIPITEVCDDPVFSAHEPVDTILGNLYVKDNPAGVLGCLEQYQMCSVTSNTCSAIGALSDILMEVTEKMPLTPMQVSTARVIVYILIEVGSIREMTGIYGGNLVASEGLITGPIQLPLPSNQWQIEKYVETPLLLEQRELCKRQRICISQGFANVSSLGLFFTIGLGTVVILLALFLDNIMGCIMRLSKGDGKKHCAWIRDDVLHLQRLAYGYDLDFGPRWIATNNDNILLVEGNCFLDPIFDLQEAKADDSQSRLLVDSLMNVDGTL